jgi:hypothetical protein
VSPRLPRPSLDGVLNLVDVDAMLEHVDVNQLLDRIDINHLLERVDIDALMARIDVNAVMAKVDIEELVQRTEIGAIIADSTSGVAQRVLDSIRAQAVSLDQASSSIVARVLRRDRATTPAGPPHFVA